MIIQSPFTPPTLFGASCRHNFSFPLLLLVIAFQGISRELQKTEIQYLRNFTERELWVSVEVFTGWRVAGSAKLCQPANDPPNLRGFRSAGAIIVYSVYFFPDIFACLLCNLLQPKPVEIGSIWWVRKFGLFLHLLEWSTVPQWCVHAMRREVPKGANLKCGLVDFQSCLLYLCLKNAFQDIDSFSPLACLQDSALSRLGLALVKKNYEWKSHVINISAGCLSVCLLASCLLLLACLLLACLYRLYIPNIDNDNNDTTNWYGSKCRLDHGEQGN